MSELKDYFLQANLAFAAYAELDIGVPAIEALTAVDMSTEQAENFADTWAIIDQYTDVSGASATVFEEIETGQRYLAVRGTESPGDIGADYLLARGFPSSLNPQFVGLQDAVQDWIDNGTLTVDFSITGHSLGGYLGVALGTSFAEAGEVYTYNAPGLDSIFGNIGDAIRDVFGLGDTALVSDVTNIRGTAGISLITGLGQQPAPPTLIETEGSGNPIDNHSIVGLTDALSLYALYGELDPSLEASEMMDILQASSGNNNESFENTLDALREILLGSDTASTPAGNREQFYENYHALKGSAQYAALVGVADIDVLTGESATSLAGINRGINRVRLD